MRRTAQPREVVLKASVPISASATAVELLERDLASLNPTIWSHAGNGVVYAACDAPSDAEPLRAARRAVQVLGDNASLIAERCPVPLKHELDVWGEPGPSVALMRAIKTKLDPNMTLNPGRYVGGI